MERRKITTALAVSALAAAVIAAAPITARAQAHTGSGEGTFDRTQSSQMNKTGIANNQSEPSGVGEGGYNPPNNENRNVTRANSSGSTWNGNRYYYHRGSGNTYSDMGNRPNYNNGSRDSRNRRYYTYQGNHYFLDLNTGVRIEL